MLFTEIMGKRRIYLYSGVLVLVFITWMFSEPQNSHETFSERVKVSLRDVGHQLLLANKDSTSLVLPVVTLDETKYRLSFQSQLSFEPSNIVSIVESSFQKAKLPSDYTVEVIQCVDQEVAYSYGVKNSKDSSIIPCRGRVLPENCYTIEVRFTNKNTAFFSKQMLLYILLGSVFLFLLEYLFHKKKQSKLPEKNNEHYDAIGIFQFYPEQNKLVKEAVEISLSRKECELLIIFIAQPNQIIKRDELTKRVWEDHGVIVSRSLDTYISKLRKKLKDDSSIKITNVHGVGYKLEILDRE